MRIVVRIVVRIIVRGVVRVVVSSWVLAMCCGATGTFTALAQIAAGEVTGTVVDPAGAPVPGATVTVTAIAGADRSKKAQAMPKPSTNRRSGCRRRAGLEGSAARRDENGRHAVELLDRIRG